MNKKGFTLVELLAVIAILAILVIIALPNVLSMFNTAKQNSFLTEVKEVFSTAQKQFMSDTTNGGASTKVTYSNNLSTACTSTKKLEMQGNATDGGSLSYSITLDSQGYVKRISVSNGTYSYTNTVNADDVATYITDGSKIDKVDATYTSATCTE